MAEVASGAVAGATDSVLVGGACAWLTGVGGAWAARLTGIIVAGIIVAGIMPAGGIMSGIIPYCCIGTV